MTLLDTLWPWLRFESAYDPWELQATPGEFGPRDFGRASVEYDPSRQAAADGDGSDVGLTNWQPPAASSTVPGLKWPQEDVSVFRVARGLGPDDFGLTALGYDSFANSVAAVEEGEDLGLGNWRPPTGQVGFDIGPDSSVVGAPTDSGGAFGLFNWRPQGAGFAEPSVGRKFNPFIGPTSDSSSDTQPWWFWVPRADRGLDDYLERRRPWLRAAPEDDVPGFHLNPDGSRKQINRTSRVKLMAGAYDPPGRATTGFIAGDGAKPAAYGQVTPVSSLQQPLGVDSLTAAARAVAKAARVLSSARALASTVTLAVRPTPIAPRPRAIHRAGDYTGKAAQLVDILMPGGQPIGVVRKGAGPNIRTVTSAEFASLAADLLTGAKLIEAPPAYKGRAYLRPDGSIVGLRWSERGPVFDVIRSNHPSIGPNFKVHQAPVRSGL